MAPMTLGYWDIRGFAQPIRFLLVTAKAEFVDHFHRMTGPPEFSKEEWFALKPTLPLDFPNLPYLYDGEVKISQSIAILRYLGRKFGLDGKTEQEKIRIDLIEQQVVDWRMQGVLTFYNPEFEKLVVDYKKGLPDKLTALSKFMGVNEYMSGGGLSYVDFLVYEWLDVHKLLVPDLLTPYPSLGGFQERIQSIPAMKTYLESDHFKDLRTSINNYHAKWGSRFSGI